MSKFEVPYFGQLNLESLKEYYSTETKFNNIEIQLDLNFENKAIESATMTAVKNILENIAKLDQQNKVYINNDYNDEDGDTVRFYLEHHLEEVDKQELSTLIDFNNKIISPEEQLLAKLHLVRVGFYPDSDEIFAVFDYSLGGNFTNYLVVVNIDRGGELDYMTIES